MQVERETEGSRITAATFRSMVLNGWGIFPPPPGGGGILGLGGLRLFQDHINTRTSYLILFFPPYFMVLYFSPFMKFVL